MPLENFKAPGSSPSSISTLPDGGRSPDAIRSSIESPKAGLPFPVIAEASAGGGRPSPKDDKSESERRAEEIWPINEPVVFENREFRDREAALRNTRNKLGEWARPKMIASRTDAYGDIAQWRQNLPAYINDLIDSRLDFNSEVGQEIIRGVAAYPLRAQEAFWWCLSSRVSPYLTGTIPAEAQFKGTPLNLEGLSPTVEDWNWVVNTAEFLRDHTPFGLHYKTGIPVTIPEDARTNPRIETSPNETDHLWRTEENDAIPESRDYRTSVDYTRESLGRTVQGLRRFYANNPDIGRLGIGFQFGYLPSGMVERIQGSPIMQEPSPVYMESAENMIRDLVNGQHTESDLRQMGLSDCFSEDGLRLMQSRFFRQIRDVRDALARGKTPEISINLIGPRNRIPASYAAWVGTWVDDPRFKAWEATVATEKPDMMGIRPSERSGPVDYEHNIFVPAPGAEASRVESQLPKPGAQVEITAAAGGEKPPEPPLSEAQKREEIYETERDNWREQTETSLNILRGFVEQNGGVRIGAEFYHSGYGRFSNSLREYTVTTQQDWPNGVVMEHSRELLTCLINTQYSPEGLRTLRLQDIFTNDILAVMQNLLFHSVEDNQAFMRRGEIPYISTARLEITSVDEIPTGYSNWLNSMTGSPQYTAWQDDRYGEPMEYFPYRPEFTAWLERQRVDPERNILTDGLTREEFAFQQYLNTTESGEDIRRHREQFEGQIAKYYMVSQIRGENPEGFIDFVDRQMALGYYTPGEYPRIFQLLGLNLNEAAQVRQGLLSWRRGSGSVGAEPYATFARAVESTPMYQAFTRRLDEAERRGVPTAIVEAFDDGRLTTNPERLMGFLGGVGEIVASIRALPMEERELLGAAVVEQLNAWYRLQGQDRHDYSEVRAIANLIPLLSLDRSPYDSEQSNFQGYDDRRWVENYTSFNNPKNLQGVEDGISQRAFEGMINLFENGRLEINNPETVIGFFREIYTAGRALNADSGDRYSHKYGLPYATEIRIVDEIAESLDRGDLDRARILSGLGIVLRIDAITSKDTGRALYVVRDVEENN